MGSDVARKTFWCFHILYQSPGDWWVCKPVSYFTFYCLRAEVPRASKVKQSGTLSSCWSRKWTLPVPLLKEALMLLLHNSCCSSAQVLAVFCKWKLRDKILKKNIIFLFFFPCRFPSLWCFDLSVALFQTECSISQKRWSFFFLSSPTLTQKKPVESSNSSLVIKPAMLEWLQNKSASLYPCL